MISPALPFTTGRTSSYAAGTPGTPGPPRPSTARARRACPGSWSACTSPATASASTPATSAPTCSNMLIAKHVDLVLTGHEHLYQRTHQLGTRTGCSTVPAGTFNAACVVDSDATMVRALGTVLRHLRPGRPGTTSRARPATARPGTSRRRRAATRTRPTATSTCRPRPTDLSAHFVPVGGTFTDAFTIHKGDPPPNVAPTAAFTSTTSNLTATFDGRAPVDPEGPIASYAWDYGDGSTPPGTGAQPSHLYADCGHLRRHADRHGRRRRDRRGDPSGHRHRSTARAESTSSPTPSTGRRPTAGDGGHRRGLVDQRHRRELRRQRRLGCDHPAGERSDPVGLAAAPSRRPTPTCGSPSPWTRCPPAAARTSTSSDAG